MVEGRLSILRGIGEVYFVELGVVVRIEWHQIAISVDTIIST